MKNNNTSKKAVFLKNAFILSATSIILRSIGIVFRVFLSNKIGAEGMGLYQLIISVYILATTFASSGINTAVTRLIAEQAGRETKKSVRHILLRALALCVLIGVVSSAIFLFGADIISKYGIGDMRAANSIRILSVGLPFIGAGSCIKGYFIARRKVMNNTSSQLLEQLVRIGTIMLIIDRLAIFGIAGACAAVMIGDVLAEIVATLHLFVLYLMDRRKIPENRGDFVPPKGVLRKILHIAVPITTGRYMNTALRTVENLLVPNTIAGYTGSREESLSQFGVLKGMALPLLLFPCSFLGSFSTMLIPEISEARALNNSSGVKKVVRQALKTTLLFAFPVSAIFLLFAGEIGNLVYNNEYAGYIIKMLVPIVPLMYLESIIDGLLKGLDQQVHTLKHSILDSVSRIAAIVIVLPKFGMNGFIIIMYASNLLTCVLNVHRLLKVSGEKMRWISWVTLPLLAGIISFFIGKLANNVLSQLVSATIPLIIIVSAITLSVYLIISFLLGCVKKEDFIIISRKLN